MIAMECANEKCGKMFVAASNRPTRKFCSKKCQKKPVKPLAPIRCANEECKQVFVAKRHDGKYCSRKCSMATHSQKRRAKNRSIPSTPIECANSRCKRMFIAKKFNSKFCSRLCGRRTYRRAYGKCHPEVARKSHAAWRKKESSLAIRGACSKRYYVKNSEKIMEHTRKKNGRRALSTLFGTILKLQENFNADV